MKETIEQESQKISYGSLVCRIAQITGIGNEEIRKVFDGMVEALQSYPPPSTIQTPLGTFTRDIKKLRQAKKTSFGREYTRDYFLTTILDPNKALKYCLNEGAPLEDEEDL